MNVCIIPARGGSKRIPRKNIKPFCGKPIIAYSIEAAIESNLFEVIMVSTDDDEIANIAISYGAEVPFMRSKRTADDFSTTYDVLEEVLLKYSSLGINFNQACCFYPCSPLTSVNVLTDACRLLDKFDSVFPVVKFNPPIQRALSQAPSQHTSFFQPKYTNVRSQDLNEFYFDAGQFYWFNTQIILQKKQLITENSGSVTISELMAQDIDSETDWLLAELKYNLIHQ